MSTLPERTIISGRGIPVMENDIDTDRIIPARFMKCVTFDGLGEYAFYDERYDEAGNTKAHPLNDPRYAGASILIVQRNFGCGSSREHAPQALARAGIQALIGESYAEIFAGNCTVMGIPAVSLRADDIVELERMVRSTPTLEITINLAHEEVRAADRTWKLSMKETYRRALASGTWDSTAELLAHRGAIENKATTLPYAQWRTEEA